MSVAAARFRLRPAFSVVSPSDAMEPPVLLRSRPALTFTPSPMMDTPCWVEL